MNAETVRTAIVVTIVTLLVWLFAESRTLRVETVLVPIEISVGGSSSAFRLTDPDSWTGSVEIELLGPAAEIDEIRGRAIKGITLEIGDELEATPGVRSVELLEAIRKDALFAQSGLTVRRTHPSLLGLETDRLETITLAVEVDLEGVQTSGPVTIEPAEIEVRIPATVASGLELHAIAQVPPGAISALTPGRRTEISQVVIGIDGLPEEAWGVRLEEPRAVVTMAIRVRTESLTLREVPVRLSLLPGDLAVWTMEMAPEDRVLENVLLTGPVSAIEQIRRGDVVLWAVATVGTEIAEGQDADAVERTVVAPVRLVGLPAGVFAEVKDRSISLTLRRRAAESDDPG